jgi:hypothetical protein
MMEVPLSNTFKVTCITNCYINGKVLSKCLWLRESFFLPRIMLVTIEELFE